MPFSIHFSWGGGSKTSIVCTLVETNRGGPLVESVLSTMRCAVKLNVEFCLFQLGTLGAGNHYAEIQVVDEIYDKFNACKMGIEHKGQVCVMIHCGSRGLGHQVATG